MLMFIRFPAIAVEHQWIAQNNSKKRRVSVASLLFFVIDSNLFSCAGIGAFQGPVRIFCLTRGAEVC